eukprot:TRINITY_DN76089_c0_g1_i19.p1 TRINITY_DN76089_c0_g1~~TRINITY_DN76089_c0_g1_i19.p1  ORF type:complete len:122 (+),score=3.47 TRINITY_DN76089_c0_g1_i19:522-887(+)
MTSISAFKHYLCKDDSPVFPYYYFGNRKDQINHCRLRRNMSNLNYDLYRRHLTDNPSCTCGYITETAEHYLLYCPLLSNVRATTLLTLQQEHFTVETMLFDDSYHFIDTSARALHCRDHAV